MKIQELLDAEKITEWKKLDFPVKRSKEKILEEFRKHDIAKNWWGDLVTELGLRLVSMEDRRHEQVWGGRYFDGVLFYPSNNEVHSIIDFAYKTKRLFWINYRKYFPMLDKIEKYNVQGFIFWYINEEKKGYYSYLPFKNLVDPFDGGRAPHDGNKVVAEHDKKNIILDKEFYHTIAGSIKLTETQL